MARAPAMLAADVAASGTTGSNKGCAAPNGDPESDRLAVLRHELAGGEGRASRIGQDGESHPRRILRLGEDRAAEFARSRSDRVRVVDGEGHAPARWATLAGQDRRHDVLEAFGRAHLLHPRAQAGVELLEMVAVARQSPHR